MASKELRSKLQLYKERKLAESFVTEFHAIEIAEFKDRDAVPVSIREAFIECTEMDAMPNSSISHDENSQARSEWRNTVVYSAGIGSEFLLKTTMESFPWARCRAVSDGWIDEVFNSMDNDVALVALDRGRWLRVYDLEYQTVAFWSAAEIP